MFSVLLSVYYRESPLYLSACLDSLFLQKLLPTEIILVLDGELTPELDSVIDKYMQLHKILKIIPLPINNGLGKALNEGLKHCTCDIVARMDTDDIAKSDRFEKQLAILADHPEIDIVGAWIDEFEENVNNIISIRKLPEKNNEIYLFAQSRNPINHPVVMFRKQAVIDAGGYQHFPLFEDYYLWIRMLINGAVFYNIQESLLFFRFSSEVFKRRGGLKYAMTEVKFQNTIRKMGFISNRIFLKNISLRFIARIIPNSFRSWIYKKILRK